MVFEADQKRRGAEIAVENNKIELAIFFFETQQVDRVAWKKEFMEFCNRENPSHQVDF